MSESGWLERLTIAAGDAIVAGLIEASNESRTAQPSLYQ